MEVLKDAQSGKFFRPLITTTTESHKLETHCTLNNLYLSHD